MQFLCWKIFFFHWLSMSSWLPPCSRDVILLHHGEIRVASFQVGSLTGFLLHFQVLSWKCRLSQLKCCIMAQKMWLFWLKQNYPWMSSCESHLKWQKWHLLDSWYLQHLYKQNFQNLKSDWIPSDWSLVHVNVQYYDSTNGVSLRRNYLFTF